MQKGDKTRKKCVLLGAIIFLIGCATPQLMKKEKIEGDWVLTIPRLSTPPTIDGKLDDPCWQKFEGFEFVFLSGVETPPQNKTKAFLAYDSNYLYLAFQCFEKEMDLLENDRVEHDSKVYGDDYVEMFFDTNHDHQTAYQILVNPNGTSADLKCDLESFGGEDYSFEAEPEIKTSIEKDYWIVEMKVAFEKLGVKKPFQGIWGINLGRGRQPKEEVDFEDTALVPTFTEASFVPENFAHLKLEVK